MVGMDMHSNLADSLISKFVLLKSRSVAVVSQLSEEDILWSPNEESNSIANLALHIRETVRHRVEAIFFGPQEIRDRDKEFHSSLVVSKDEAIAAFEQSFDILIQVVKGMSEEDFLKQPYMDNPPAQSAMNKEATVLDICLQMLAHLSEHAGQIFYIAKARLNDQYVTTTFPKKKE
ncbi:DUF1572 family protein [Brevibacillus nitrificans]